MLTIVLTYRNRDLYIVKRCLDSLYQQSDEDFKLFLVDYGSDNSFVEQLEKLLEDYTFVTSIYVSTQGQLWNKSRAINIAFKKCKTPYFLMGDIDLVYHKDMVKYCKEMMKQYDCVYFKYGFLSEEETKKDLGFNEYETEFYGNQDVTGTTLYRTDVLKSINGYDEFYHGWGAEDTDVHLRLKNAGYDVYFYEKEILVKHQWHPKAYRSKNSTAPFHTNLERINHDYMWQQFHSGATVANTKFNWGELTSESQVQKLKNIDREMKITTEKRKLDALLFGVLPELSVSVELIITYEKGAKSLKNQIKKILGRKSIHSYTIEEANNMLLLQLISHHRLASYNYSINWSNDEIVLTFTPYEKA
ncbi:hypothetical protein NBRC110019_10850 [Neptunitalea chrysea]|uniref:Glycosyltransferase n=1 Tax=Neptunitalea chrysea TaxID=1647581 RepID=A0A9W6B3X2_9FLAO|nr:glycosyltransferase [Neptunitalea chrysea]GLB52046.1 hypothetical protein NBRC110019_10850 [Neptunitalea chrysea]